MGWTLLFSKPRLLFALTQSIKNPDRVRESLLREPALFSEESCQTKADTVVVVECEQHSENKSGSTRLISNEPQTLLVCQSAKQGLFPMATPNTLGLKRNDG
jgi:hypothetical protein